MIISVHSEAWDSIGCFLGAKIHWLLFGREDYFSTLGGAWTSTGCSLGSPACSLICSLHVSSCFFCSSVLFPVKLLVLIPSCLFPSCSLTCSVCLSSCLFFCRAVCRFLRPVVYRLSCPFSCPLVTVLPTDGTDGRGGAGQDGRSRRAICVKSNNST